MNNSFDTRLFNMSDDRQNALERFYSEYQDQRNEIDTIPSEPKSGTPITLKPTSAILVIGYLSFHSTRFFINFTCRSTGDVALHFNPRLDRGYIVRNSKVKGSWAHEETCSPAAPVNNLFTQNSYFHLVIFCAPQGFYIAVNGQHFCTFSYRLPLDAITHVEHDGDVEDVRVRQTTLWIYPDPRIMKPMMSFVLTDGKPLTHNFMGPSTVSIVQRLCHGVRIFMKGRLKLLPHSFYINLQKSSLLHPHPEIALHLNPRFQYGIRPSCVVMNCWTTGSWRREERHEGHFTWAPGREFLLTIQCGYDHFIIWLGNKMIGEFKYQLELSIVDTLLINGDVIMNELFLSFED